MTVAKTKDAGAGKPPESQTTTTSTQGTARKPWKKKTPVQILLDQVEKLRDEIKQDEEALKQKKDQLQKFEEARKLFEGK